MVGCKVCLEAEEAFFFFNWISISNDASIKWAKNLMLPQEKHTKLRYLR